MKLLVVSKFPLRGKHQDMICDAAPGEADIKFIGIGPKHHDGDFSRDDLKQFRADFSAEGYDGVLALGNEALFVTAGKSGIMKYRGRSLSDEYPLIASVSTHAVERNPSQLGLLTADVATLVRNINGEVLEGVEPEQIHTIGTPAEIEKLLDAISSAAVCSFDLETSGFDETAEGAFIVSLGLTLCNAATGELTCWAVPLCHSESPFQNMWNTLLLHLATRMRKVPVRLAHNGKFDCKWLAQFDAPVPITDDTMLMAHILDENRRKSLKHLAAILLQAPEWDIEIKNGKKAAPWYEQHSLAEILHYNALDTWHTLRLYDLFRPQLDALPAQDKIYRKVMVPSAQSLVYIERYGVYVDQDKLEYARQIVEERLDSLHTQLAEFIPDHWGAREINWNPSNFLRELLFEELALPVLEKTDTGLPSTAEHVMKELASRGYEIAQVLADRVEWQKANTSFIKPYQMLLSEDSRLRTTFNLTGTVTGRLSSGKESNDTGAAGNPDRGVNLQQVPRNKLFRGIFGAPEGWLNVSFDYSQIELRGAAEVAQEKNMLQMYQEGLDVHRAMAVTITGKAAEDITKEERTGAKAANFGFLYGMGWRKFVDYAFNTYGVRVSDEEAQAFRAAFFDRFPRFQAWHQEQRRYVRKHHRVVSPLGRVRHLPDILSPDDGVKAEAERQAINSPVQAFASDICLISLALLHRKMSKGGYRTAVTGTVHDAINFEIPREELSEVVPIIKSTMENPPTQQLFNYEIKVPLVVDVSVGTHWGEQQELTSLEELSQWTSTA